MRPDVDSDQAAAQKAGNPCGAAVPRLGLAVTRRGPAPTLYSQAAARRAPRSASVDPRGSQSARSSSETNSPGAPTHAQAPCRALAGSRNHSPRLCGKLCITRVCANRRRCTLGALKAATSRRDSTGHAPLDQRIRSEITRKERELLAPTGVATKTAREGGGGGGSCLLARLYPSCPPALDRTAARGGVRRTLLSSDAEG